jgi:peptidyl-tRNA hydrolase, PTH1 family
MTTFLIAGLGNIGDEYIQTRHNIGFEIVEALAAEAGASFVLNRHAYSAEIKFRGKKLFLIKPSTYMNLSGKAIRYWMQELNVPNENLLVILDDIALPFGKLRIRSKGSDGGHNGLKNIQELIGTTVYPRMRFGIENNFSKGKQVDYVLGKWSAEEKKLLPERIENACHAIKSFATIGLERTMNVFN